MTTSRHVLIFRCLDGVGLGSILILIAGYARYCQRNGIVLALDMRGFQYFSSERHRRFFEAFDLRLPADLELITDIVTIDHLYADPRCAVVERPATVDWAIPHPAPILIVDGVINRQLCPWFGTELPPGWALGLKDMLATAVAPVLAGWAARGSVVGVHFRHGNGEFMQSRLDYLTTADYPARMRQVWEAMAQRIAQRAGSRAVLITGDNRDFVAFMLQRLPNAFTLGASVPDRPYLEFLQETGPEQGLVDAVRDLWGLAACDELVCGQSSFAEAVLAINPALGGDRLEVFRALDLKAEIRDADPETALLAVQLLAIGSPTRPARWDALAAAFTRAGRIETAAACRAVAAELAAAPRQDRGAMAGALRAVAGVEDAVRRLYGLAAQGTYQAHAIRQLAGMLVQAGLADLAADLLRAAIAARPGDAALQALLADILLATPQAADVAAEILAAAEIAATLAPQDGRSQRRLGRAMLLAGRTGAAEQVLAAACAAAPPSAADLFLLAKARHRLGHPAAQATLAQAIALNKAATTQ